MWREIFQQPDLQQIGKPLSSLKVILILVAGTDIEFSGNPSNTIQRMMTAKEQVSISGTVSREGFLIAADIDTSGNLVTGNTISPSLTVSCNGDIVATFLSNKEQLIAWQEN